MNNLTPWFDGRIHKPARKGVYMLMSGKAVGYQYWDGRCWSAWDFSAEAAFRLRRWETCDSYHDDNWRGLASDPEKQP